MPCVSLIAAPNLRSPRAGRGVLKSMSELQALEQSSRVATRKNFQKRISSFWIFGVLGLELGPAGVSGRLV